MTYCRHVYEDVGQDICPDCGNNTHRLNWKFEAAMHKDWIDSGKAVRQGWSSI